MDESELGRRTYLEALLATGTVTGLAGCSSSQDDSATNTTTEAPNTTSNQDSPTATQNQAPRILAHEAIPQNNGTSLAVHLEAEDDNKLSVARIEYGGQTIERTPESASVTIDDELTEFGGTALNKLPGRVTFLLRDSTGRETRIETSPDDTAPQLRTLVAGPTENAGEISVTLHGRDNKGLEKLQLFLIGSLQLQEDVSGQKETAVETTVDVSDNATVGEENALTAMLEDWNGNTTENDSDTYVRKFDKMGDTRLSFGAVYQAYMWDFNEGNRLEGNNNRIPKVGQYGRPIKKWIFKRHMDQMQGHGINRLMIECSGDQRARESNDRFLEFSSGLKNDFDEIEPFFVFLENLWNGQYPQSADNFREELLEPNMKWIRENIFSKENASTYDGRPVIQMWNPNSLTRDYQHDKIMDEFGSYESFVDAMRNLLSGDGRDPYLVGGANWYGATGYPDRGEKIHQQFDAVTTWTAGGAWLNNEDNETTKQEVLEYVEDNFRGHREFTDEHDMDFVPMVFPGFNETKRGRRHPRSPELFEELLDLAEEYRTTEMVNSSVYNQWEEMTTLEPGIFTEGPFGDESYGTAYLDVVEEFQQE